MPSHLIHLTYSYYLNNSYIGNNSVKYTYGLYQISHWENQTPCDIQDHSLIKFHGNISFYSKLCEKKIRKNL